MSKYQPFSRKNAEYDVMYKTTQAAKAQNVALLDGGNVNENNINLIHIFEAVPT